MRESLRKSLGSLEQRLGTWVETGLEKLPSLALATLVVALGVLLARWLGRAFRRTVRRFSDSTAIVTLCSTLLQGLVVCIAGIFACGILGLDKTLFSLLAGAGVLGIALGFALQDLATNLIAGVAMGFRKPFCIGHLVETGGHLGHVERLNLRNTILRTFQGQAVIIPNRTVFEGPLVNHTRTGERRVDVAVGVAYDTDLERATRLARGAVGELEACRDDREVEVVATGFGASAIDLSVRFWIDPGDSYPQALHAGVLAVHRTFRDNDVEIPFPIRTLDLRGAEALEALSEELQTA